MKGVGVGSSGEGGEGGIGEGRRGRHLLHSRGSGSRLDLLFSFMVIEVPPKSIISSKCQIKPWETPYLE